MSDLIYIYMITMYIAPDIRNSPRELPVKLDFKDIMA
jgi:hypothetical protein